MLPVLEIGPLSIQTSGLVFILGFWLAISQVEKWAEFYGANPKEIDDLILVGVISGLAAARLAEVIRFPASFRGNILDVLSLDPGLLDIPTGILVGIFSAAVFGQRKRMALWNTLDALVPGLAVSLLASGLAHLASGSAYGSPTGLPWAIDLWGAGRHPTQLYEVILAMGILACVYPRRSSGPGTRSSPVDPGRTFLKFLALAAGARIVLESFRGDSMFLFDRLRVAQIVAWAVLAASLWLLSRRGVKEQTEQAVGSEEA